MSVLSDNDITLDLVQAVQLTVSGPYRLAFDAQYTFAKVSNSGPNLVYAGPVAGDVSQAVAIPAGVSDRCQLRSVLYVWAASGSSAITVTPATDRSVQLSRRAGSIFGTQEVIASRGCLMTGRATMGTLSAASTIGNWRYTIDLLNDYHDIRLVYWNGYFAASGGSAVPVGNAFTLTSSFETQVGSTTPLRTTFAGAASFAFPSTHVVLAISDPIPTAGLAGQIAAARSCITVSASTDFVPVATATSVSDGTTQDADVFGSDVTMSAAPGFGVHNGHQQYAPIAIIATPNGLNPTPCVIFLGDSIPDGTGDHHYGTAGFMVRAAMLEYAATNTFPVLAARPYVNLSHSGAALFDLASPTAAPFRNLIAQLGKTAIVQLSVNDLSTRTLAQTKADFLTVWRQLASRGIRVFQIATSLRTYSSRGWTDLAHQYPCGGLVNSIANNGSNLVRVTFTASVAIVPNTGDQVTLAGFGGANTALNATWPVTKISPTTFDLVGSTWVDNTGVGVDTAFSDLTIEAQRAAGVSWLYDTSSTGAMAQAGGNLAGVLDVTAAFEVNANGVPTRNGGRFSVPTTFETSGVVASSSGATNITVSGTPFTGNVFQGYKCALDRAADGITYYRTVTANGTNTLTVSTFGFTPGVGDTWRLYKTTADDGVHYTDEGHRLAAVQLASLMPAALGVG